MSDSFRTAPESAERSSERAGIPVGPTPAEPAPDDGRLAAALLGGDAEALAEVRRWIRGALSPYRPRLAPELEDVEQQVVVELLEALAASRFEGRSRLSTYVRRMTHHKCLNRLRGLRGRQWLDVSDLELVDGEPTPFEQTRRRESLDLALRVLARMPEACVELWSMLHRGLGYDEMGERLGVAAGTLRVRVLRCREKAVAERERLAAGGGVTAPPDGRQSESR